MKHLRIPTSMVIVVPPLCVVVDDGHQVQDAYHILEEQRDPAIFDSSFDVPWLSRL